MLLAHSKQFVWENVNNRTLVDFIHFIALMLGLGALHAGYVQNLYFIISKQDVFIILIGSTVNCMKHINSAIF